MMSSTSAVLMPVRSASARNTVAPSCCGWMPDQAPLPALPMPRGVLHASIVSASPMVLSLCWLAAFAADRAILSIRSRPPGSDGAPRNPRYVITSLPSPQRQNLLRSAQVRLVDHLTVDLH